MRQLATLTSHGIQRLYRSLPSPVREQIRPITNSVRPWLARRSQALALTAEQVECWEENGYLILKNFFPAERVNEVNDYVDYLWRDRTKIPGLPFVIDAYVETPNVRRMLLKNADDAAREQSYKLYDLYLESEMIRRFVLDPQLSSIIAALFGGEALICNTINFEYGSKQDYHFDTFYMPPPTKNGLVASWIALEKITMESGPLRYVPGTHKIPPFIFESSGTTVPKTEEELPIVREYVMNEIEKRGLKEEVFTGDAGDVFIWHEQLLHGGLPITDPAATRKSIVTHYWRVSDIPAESRRSDTIGRAYLNRAHQKSEEATPA